MFKEAKAVLDGLIPLQKHMEILEKMLVAKFGSYDNAKKEIGFLRKKYSDDVEFINSMNDLIYPEKLRELFTPLLSVKKLPELVEYAAKLNLERISGSFSEEELSTFIKMKEIYTNEVNSQIFENGKITLFDEVDKKVRFTIKEIRDDLQIDQRTFKKWLNLIFKEKYDGVRTISLTQYIEIYEQLILKEQENKFDFNFNAKEYFNRIQNGLVFSKQRLLKLTDSDYKQLAIKMKSMDLDFAGMDVFPFNIAHKIIEVMD